MSERTIAIIGGGFCGTLVAVHLLRSRGAGDLHVILINRSGPLARGVAYGTRTETHVLNVPAGRMGAFPDDEEGFLHFARRRDPAVSGGDFLPRRWYGEYLEWLLEDAIANTSASRRFSHRVGHVVDVMRTGAAVDVVFADGAALRADRVVLALGNFAPSDPPVEDRTFYRDSARYVRDPWLPGALDAVDLSQPVLLIGTGLTAVDIALDLVERGLRAPLYALSRRGLAPLAHRADIDGARAVTLPDALWSGPATARHYLHTLRRQIDALAAQGVDWRDTIGALRPFTPQLWQRLSRVERARFLRHLQPYWEVHRHRLAPALARRFAALIESGRLQLRGGRLRAFEADAQGVNVSFRARGAAGNSSLRVGAVINCTGPNSNMRRSHEPLLAALAARGLLRSDALGLGLEVADNYALLDAHGAASTALFYVGPFLKAKFWEATAVPELRVHVRELARVLLAPDDSA